MLVCLHTQMCQPKSQCLPCTRLLFVPLPQQQVLAHASVSPVSFSLWPTLRLRAVPIPCVPRAFAGGAGETKRVCTICLENYEEGDKVRILPCYHR